MNSAAELPKSEILSDTTGQGTGSEPGAAAGAGVSATAGAGAGANSMSKTEVIIGRAGIERLAQAHVLVIGCGGVGSSCVEALARGGVGSLTFLDRDIVAESNINRQAIAFRSTIGRAKVDVMRDMVLDINPACSVETFERFLAPEDVPAFLDGFRITSTNMADDTAETTSDVAADAADASAEPGAAGADATTNALSPNIAAAPSIWRFDWVIDAIDTISVKLALAAYANEHNMPLVASMGGGNKLDPTRLAFADLYDTVNCPLCRIMRKEGRKRGIRRLPVLYSSEIPARTETAPGATRADRSDLGTMSYFPPIMGQMLAGWVIRQIVGI